MWHVHLQEIVIGLALHLDEVGHFRHFGYPPEGVSDALAPDETFLGKNGQIRLWCHWVSRLLAPPGKGGDDVEKAVALHGRQAGRKGSRIRLNPYFVTANCHVVPRANP